MNEAQFERFRKSIEPFLGDWNSIDLRVIAVEIKSGEWHYISIRAVLDSTNASEPTRKDLPSIPKLLVAHERRDVKRLDELLDGLLKGRITVNGLTINVERFSGQTWQPDYSANFDFRGRMRCRSEFSVDYSSFLLRIWESMNGVADYRELALINAAFVSGDPPWDGLTELRQKFIGFPRDIASREDFRSVEVIAPLGVNLGGGTELEGEKILAVLETRLARPTKNTSISVIADFPDGSTSRIHCSVEKREGKVATLIDLPRVPSRVNLVVSHGGIEVDRMSFLETIGLRLSVLEKLGVGIPTLRSILEDSKGREFENFYSILLHLLGFSPAHYGALPLETPDIIAFPDSGGWVLVVECTGREPDLNNKLTKLSTRAKEISQTREGLLPIQLL